jgi:FkbM family methyltransferase
MKFEEKIKNKYLYSKGFNLFKVLYFLYQLIKTKKILKEKKFYSNWGIDMMADDFFKKKKNGIYIDVGCHQPFLNNNTYRLYKRGWIGINIDLDFNSIELFNFFRKRDTNIQAAISDKSETKDLFFFHNRSPINTLSAVSGHKAKEIRKIRTQTLNEIIQKTKFKDKKIDYISIDVEGTELKVLMGFDLKKYKPDLIILEFIDPKIKEFYQQNIDNILNSELNKYMKNNDYKFINWIHDDLVYVPNCLN